MKGTGLLVALDLHECQSHLTVLTEEIVNQMRRIVYDVGLSPLVHCEYQFHDTEGRPDGYSLAIVLAESHITVHTWPSLRKANVCVYTCNYCSDNNTRARLLAQRIVEYFGSREPHYREMERT